MSASSAEWFKAEFDYLVAAAECVESAAATAMLWAGGDSQGVLSEVCAADPHSLAASRLSARMADEYVRELPDLAAYERALAEEAGEPGSGCVVAAHPMWMVPRWAARVSVAVDEARAATLKQGCLGRQSAREAVSGYVRVYALTAVQRWGVEPVSLDDIAEAARMVDYLCGLPSMRPAGKTF